MLAHHGAHLRLAPLSGIRSGQEVSDLVPVGVPRVRGVGDGVGIAGLGCSDQLGYANDVLAEED